MIQPVMDDLFEKGKNMAFVPFKRSPNLPVMVVCGEEFMFDLVYHFGILENDYSCFLFEMVSLSLLKIIDLANDFPLYSLYVLLLYNYCNGASFDFVLCSSLYICNSQADQRAYTSRWANQHRNQESFIRVFHLSFSLSSPLTIHLIERQN